MQIFVQHLDNPVIITRNLFELSDIFIFACFVVVVVASNEFRFQLFIPTFVPQRIVGWPGLCMQFSLELAVANTRNFFFIQLIYVNLVECSLYIRLCTFAVISSHPIFHLHCLFSNFSRVFTFFPFSHEVFMFSSCSMSSEYSVIFISSRSGCEQKTIWLWVRILDASWTYCMNFSSLGREIESEIYRERV